MKKQGHEIYSGWTRDGQLVHVIGKTLCIIGKTIADKITIEFGEHSEAYAAAAALVR